MSARPIDAVAIRKRKKEVMARPKGVYPLYKTSTNEDTFNFSNIKDSMYMWESYSENWYNNWMKLLSLYESVIKYGTKQQLQEAADVINTAIIPYSINPSIMKETITRLSESHKENVSPNRTNDVQIHYYNMLENLTEVMECDRVQNNYNMISQRFNINKIIENNILYEDAVTETVYSVCGLIDTYSSDYKTKFCIASEAVLLAVYNTIGTEPIEEEYLKDKISTEKLLETVTDYFLINYGRANTDQFLLEMEDAAHKDPFIRETLDGYFKHLRIAHNQMINEDWSDSLDNETLKKYAVEDYSAFKERTIQETADNIQSKYYDDTLMGLAADLEQFHVMRENTEKLVGLQEFNLEDLANKTQEMMTKIKMLPSQSIGALKTAIQAILVPCRQEDIAKGTHNALAMIFYCAITLGWFMMGGPLAGALGAILTYTFSKVTQKKYFQTAIQEWREHKYSVQRKLKSCDDPEKRRRMEAYISQIEHDIKQMEDKYDRMRDPTVDELHNMSQKRMESPDYGNKTSQVNPKGLVTPTSNLYDSKKPGMAQFTKHDDAPSKIKDDFDDEEDDYYND